jgi:hypothetical protein
MLYVLAAAVQVAVLAVAVVAAVVLLLVWLGLNNNLQLLLSL